jgi:hypothetical protein
VTQPTTSNTTTEEAALPRANRRQLQICFWTLFVLAPLSVPIVAFGSMWLSNDLSVHALDGIPLWVRMLGAFCLCHVGAAYCLATLWSAEPGEVVRETVLYSILLLFAYFGIGYVLFPGLWLVAQFIGR